MKDVYGRLNTHFNGDSSKACLAIAAFALGITVFVINNTVLFFVDEMAYFWPRLCMKTITDLSWIAGAMLGTRYYPTRRNVLLMPTLVFYMFGDVAVFFSVPVGGIFYGIGHLFMIAAILETTYLHRYQKITYGICIFIAPIMLVLYYPDNLLYIAAGSLYGLIVIAVMAFSLSNRFFWLAGVVFTVSDLTGLIRISMADNKFTYIITTTIYFAAVFMLCISVYSTNRKEVVTWVDLFSLLKDARRRGIRFWVCGTWAVGLIRGNKKYSYDHIELAFDAEKEEEFFRWLKLKRYYKNENEKSGGTREYYSERYGTLITFKCRFGDDGTAVLMSEKGHHLELDEGFFREISVMGRVIPCIAPGGQELIKDVIEGEEQDAEKNAGENAGYFAVDAAEAMW